MGLALNRRNKSKPRPYLIEHRAVAPELINECREWGEWSTFATYIKASLRDRALGQMLQGSSGRWEYRSVDDV